MSYLLELLGRGLDDNLEELLSRHYWSPPRQDIGKLRAQAVAHPDWPDVRFQVGLAHLRSMEITEAIEHLAAACRRKPDYLAARLALAAALEEHGDVAGALEQLKIANQTHTAHAAVLFSIGFCLEKLRRGDQAAEYYRDAVKAQPSYRVARERLAAVAVAAGRVEEAIEQYQTLCQEFPNETWLRTAMAHLYFRQGLYDQAVEQFETAIAMEPENWALVDDEVEALVAQGQLREAIERLKSLLERQGDFADLHVRLGDLYSQCGDDESAMKHLQTARALQPTYLEAAVKLGTHHMINGRWDQAAEAFCDAIELNDRLLTSYVGMGVSQAAGGSRVDAMSSFDLAAAIEPNSTVLLAEMARLQLKSSVAEDFARGFEKGLNPPMAELDLENDHLLARQIERHAEEVARHGGHADLRYRYGVLLRSEGRLGEAMEQFRQAVVINPNYTAAIIKLGITQQELGQTNEAIETFTRALDIKPQFVDLHYRLGLLHTDRRQFAQAVEHMEKALAGAPDNQTIRAGLALSLQNMGLMDRSVALWRSMWKLNPVKT